MKRFGILVLCMFILCGCGRQKAAQRTIFAMDTVMELQLWGTDAEAAVGQLQETINTLEADWSATRADSILHRMRNEAIDPDAQALLDRVAEISDRTGGLYDPQLYSLSSAWGFYGQNYRLPTETEIALALADTQWDLGGALKGYCGDRAVTILNSMDVDYGILNLGGNIQTFGQKPDGTPWQIGIQNPDGGEPVAVVSVTGTTAVITSGDYQRSFTLEGSTYHHIMDPRTGYPADSGLRSVTIICADGLTADCLSTALFVMGLEDGTQFWRESTDFEAVFLTTDGAIFATEGVTISGCNYEVIRR